MTAWVLCGLMLGGSAAHADEPVVERVSSALRWAGGTRQLLRYQVNGVPVERAGGLRDRDAAGVERRSQRPRLVEHTLGVASLSAADAVERTERAAALIGRGRLWPSRSERVLWPTPQGLVPAWGVDVGVRAPLGTWRWIVDARTGELLAMRRTSMDVVGQVYLDNPILGDLVQEPLLGLSTPEALAGDYVTARSCVDAEIDPRPLGVSRCNAASGVARPNSGGDFVFEPAEPGLADPFAEVNLYFQVDAVARYFDERFGVRHARSIDAFTNFEMANAFYGDFDGDGLADMAFGEHTPTGVDLAYDGDVVKHEYGHAVVDAVSLLGWLSADRYGMEWAGGSLNEGLADAVAMALTGDPQVGEYAGTAFEAQDGVRNLDADRRCPDDLYGEVHVDGEILGSLFWNLIEDPRVGPERAIDLAVGAASTWMPDEDWPKAGRSLLDAAQDLVDAGSFDAEAQQAVVSEVQRANLLDCGRVAELVPSQARELILVGAGLRGDFSRIAGGVQLSMAVPTDAVALHLKVAGPLESLQGWTLTWRRGEPVEHQVRSVAMLGLAVAAPITYDGLLDGIGQGTVDLPVGPDQALQGGDTIFFALASRTESAELLDIQMDRVALTVDVVAPEPSGGCGCASRSPTGWEALALAAALGLRRRREQTR